MAIFTPADVAAMSAAYAEACERILLQFGACTAYQQNAIARAIVEGFLADRIPGEALAAHALRAMVQGSSMVA